MEIHFIEKKVGFYSNNQTFRITKMIIDIFCVFIIVRINVVKNFSNLKLSAHFYSFQVSLESRNSYLGEF